MPRPRPTTAEFRNSTVQTMVRAVTAVFHHRRLGPHTSLVIEILLFANFALLKAISLANTQIGAYGVL